MTREVVTIEREASLRRARRIMENRQIRHLPVVEKERLVGVITDRDIRAAAPSSAANIAPEVREEFLDHLKVGHVMTKKVLNTTPERTIEEAALLMRRHKISCLPVLEGERLVGIITETDIFKVFLEVLGLEESSARLEISFDRRPGFVAELCRTIDEQGCRLVSLLILPGEEGEAVVILRLDAPIPTALQEALSQGGFTVISAQHPAVVTKKGREPSGSTPGEA